MSRIKAEVYKNRSIPEWMNMDKWYFSIPGDGYAGAASFEDAIRRGSFAAYAKDQVTLSDMSKQERQKAPGMYCATPNGLAVLFGAGGLVIYEHDRDTAYAARMSEIVPLPERPRVWGEEQKLTEILAWLESPEWGLVS